MRGRQRDGGLDHPLGKLGRLFEPEGVFSVNGEGAKADCNSVELDFADAVVDRVAALSERGYNWLRRPKRNLL